MDEEAFDRLLSQVRATSAFSADQYGSDIRQFRDWLRTEQDGKRLIEADVFDIEQNLVAMEDAGHTPSSVDRRQAALSEFYEQARKDHEVGVLAADNSPAVRQFGYVRDEPIIRQVDDGGLYLGNVAAADSFAHDRQFGHVLSATEDEQPLTTHHHPLIDGEGNDWSTFERAIDTARRLYRSDSSLLIHCTVGVSRSSTVLATTLAAERGLPLCEGVEAVRSARPVANINPALRDLASRYVRET